MTTSLRRGDCVRIIGESEVGTITLVEHGYAVVDFSTVRQGGRVVLETEL